MTAIIFKERNKYRYNLSRDDNYNAFKQHLQSAKRVKETNVAECLHFLAQEIHLEANKPFFNIIRLMTIIDALSLLLSEKLHASENVFELKAAFSSEATRMLLSLFDNWEGPSRLECYRDIIKNEYQEYSSHKSAIARNEIVAAATDAWGIDFHNDFPEKKQYASGFDYRVFAEACEEFPDIAPLFQFYNPEAHAEIIILEEKLTKPENLTIKNQAQKALEYAYDAHLSQKYQEAKDYDQHQPVIFYDRLSKKVGMEGFYKAFDASKHPETDIAWRCNHGLSHTARTLALVPEVFHFNLNHALPKVKDWLSTQDANSLIEKVQVAMAFYVTGRESEAAFSAEPDSPYNRYRKQSAVNFTTWLEANPEAAALFDGPDEIALFAECIEHSYLYDEDLEKFSAEKVALKTLLYGAHCADLTRCKSDYEIQKTTVDDLLKAVPAAEKTDPGIRHQASMIFGKASDLGIQMRSPIQAAYDPVEKKFIGKQPPYGGSRYMNETFIAYETSVDKCLDLLNHPPIIAQNENAIATQTGTDAIAEKVEEEVPQAIIIPFNNGEEQSDTSKGFFARVTDFFYTPSLARNICLGLVAGLVTGAAIVLLISVITIATIGTGGVSALIFFGLGALGMAGGLGAMIGSHCYTESPVLENDQQEQAESWQKFTEVMGSNKGKDPEIVKAEPVIHARKTDNATMGKLIRTEENQNSPL